MDATEATQPQSATVHPFTRLDWPDMPKRLREDEAAAVLRCSGRTIRRYASRGLIRALRPTSGKTLYDRDSLRTFLEGVAA